MTAPFYIGPEIETRLSWAGAVDAIRAGHLSPRAKIADTLIPKTNGEVLTRSASIKGLGAGVKAVSIHMKNPSLSPPLPAVQGAFFLFDDATGALSAIIGGPTLTKWKTIADSLAGASLLARPDPRTLAIVGTGFIAEAAISAYVSFFPTINAVRIWGRTCEKAEALAARHDQAITCGEIGAALDGADIIVGATAAKSPIIRGEMVKEGAHVDLIGAYGPEHREADDELMARARLFVDSFETTVDHIGEIMIPLRNGVISRSDIEADLYRLCSGSEIDRADQDITLYKNGGGAHLDLMIARYISSERDHRTTRTLNSVRD